MKIRKVSFVLIKTSILLALAGIIILDYELVALAAFPILLLLVPYIPCKLKDVKVDVEGGKYVNEPFTARINLTAKGFGLLKVQHTLPEFFDITEGQNTVQTFVPGIKHIHLAYTANPSRRGFYELDKISYQTENPLMTGRKSYGEVEIDVTLEVKQRIQKVLKVGNLRGIATSPLPDVDISRIGVPGTDFREIKEYTPGDPMKFINWKATARKDKLMVNKYEVEGKKAVWIFLDANRYMMHGTAIKNYLEAAVEAANSLTYYFASRGYKVGMYVVGTGQLLYPDTGQRQFRRVGDTLLTLEASNNVESFDHAFESCKRFLVIYNPLVMFITRVEYSKPLRAILKLSKFSKKRKVPIDVITLKQKQEEELATLLLETIRDSMVTRIRSRGRVIEWDIDTPLSKVLMKQMIHN
ncbi:MAG: DUF58 domain-containing protein [Halobacteriota archaeon]